MQSTIREKLDIIFNNLIFASLVLAKKFKTSDFLIFIPQTANERPEEGPELDQWHIQRPRQID